MKLKRVFKTKRNPNSNGTSRMSDFDDDRYITPVQFELTRSEWRDIIKGYDKEDTERTYWLDEKLNREVNDNHGKIVDRDNGSFYRETKYVVISITDTKRGYLSNTETHDKVKEWFEKQPKEYMSLLLQEDYTFRVMDMMTKNCIGELTDSRISHELKGKKYRTEILVRVIRKEINKHLVKNGLEEVQ